MSFNADLIGKTYDEVRLEVTADGVASFARAIGEHNPAFFNPDAARALGLAGQAAPPTILAWIQIVAVNEITSDPLIGASFDGIVHTEQAYNWVRPVVVGDKLSTIPTIADIRAKGSLSFMDVHLDIRDGDGEHVVLSRSTLVEMGAGA